MEMIYFTLVAVGLYAVSDMILNKIELKRGERLANRSVVFFLIITTLAVITFTIIQKFVYMPENSAIKESTQLQQPQTQPQSPAPSTSDIPN